MSGEGDLCGEHCLECKCEPKKMGRPPSEIDWKVFEELCFIQCTIEELASVLKVCEDTLYDKVEKKYGETFSVVYKRFASGGKSSLRRHQLNLAKKNASMGIWLGKQYLNQKDISKEEMKDMVEELKDAIKESEGEPRTQETQRSDVAPQQPLSHQGQSGEQGQVQIELGSTTTL